MMVKEVKIEKLDYGWKLEWESERTYGQTGTEAYEKFEDVEKRVKELLGE